MDIFNSATIKLTLWYLLIIIAISLTFSGIIFHLSNNALQRELLPRGPRFQSIVNDPEAFMQLQRQRMDEAAGALLYNLLILNLLTLISGGGASYLLARRTLRPTREAIDEQSRFTSDASHELRTPLATLQMENEVALRKKSLPAPRMRRVIESNLEEIRRLRALSDKLLLLSGDTSLELQDTPLDEVVIEATSRMATQAKTKKIKIENTVGSHVVKGNPDSLTDLLVILLDNAIKYSASGTKIRLDAKTEGKSIVLSVADSGYGIKSSDLPRIFDRFYRADSSRSKENAEGYGLGLSIAQRIAEQHSSKLTVNSDPGKGTTFYLKLESYK